MKDSPANGRLRWKMSRQFVVARRPPRRGPMEPAMA
jgi:hypothetical protein